MATGIALKTQCARSLSGKKGTLKRRRTKATTICVNPSKLIRKLLSQYWKQLFDSVQHCTFPLYSLMQNLNALDKQVLYDYSPIDRETLNYHKVFSFFIIYVDFSYNHKENDSSCKNKSRSLFNCTIY